MNIELSNKTILVTGGAGFIGSRLCAQFLALGAKVVCLDNLSTGTKAGYVGQQIINKREQGEIDPKQARILVLGITFKPNCPGIRNSKVVDLINYLLGLCASVTVADPWADPKQAIDSYGLSLTSDYKSDKFDVVVLAVHHREFLQINMDELFNDSGFSFDITSVSLQPKSK